MNANFPVANNYNVAVCPKCNHAFASQRVILLTEACCTCHEVVRMSVACNANGSAKFTEREAKYAANLINGNFETKT